MKSRHILQPAIVRAQGNKPKSIEEFVGRVNSGTDQLSIARMRSPQGWEEPGQKPEFDEYSLVLRGVLRVQTADEFYQVTEGQLFHAAAGEWVQYSTPYEGGAEYIAVCCAAFSPELVNRDRA